MRNLYYERLAERTANIATNTKSLTDERYIKLIKEVSIKKISDRKDPSDYWLLRQYDVISFADTEKLIKPLSINENSVRNYVPYSQLFDVLNDSHISVGHGGRDRMIKEISKKYVNITRKEIELYIKLCQHCLQKQKGLKKGLVVKPIISTEFNSRCQVDLIDFQSHPDGEYKFIMVYQDHLTKFVVIKPLKFKKSIDVAMELFDIFTLLGAPSILQSDNGREFSNSIVTSLKSIWPELTIVHGKPRHSQSQGSVERANQDIQNMLTTWMQDNKTPKWSHGLKFVQIMKNSALHSGIGRTPYEAVFGQTIKLGLSTSNLPKDIYEKLQSEENLEHVFDSIIDTSIDIFFSFIFRLKYYRKSYFK